MSEDLNEEKLVKVACLLQDLTHFLRDTSLKRRPARDHDIYDDYIPATIATASRSAAYYLPQVNDATGVLHDAIAELSALKAGKDEAITEVSAETFSSDGTSDIITCNLPIGTKLYLSAPPASADARLVPVELLERIAREADRYDDSPMATINDNCELWQIGHVRLKMTVGDLRELRALLAQSESEG